MGTMRMSISRIRRFYLGRCLGRTPYDIQNICRLLKNIACNFQVVFCVGMTLALKILLSENHGDPQPKSFVSESGDELYHWRDSVKIPYSDYVNSVVYKLAALHNVTSVDRCDVTAFDIHDQAGLPIRETPIMKTLGDTNVHSLAAILDDRLLDRKFVRIFGVGLHPGHQLHCLYECPDSESKRCSSPAQGVIVLAGTPSDYPALGKRKSLMDVMTFACPVRPQDKPSQVILTLRPCGYSHNVQAVTSLDTQGVVAPPWEVGVCVRPINITRLKANINIKDFARWIEFWRINGAGQLHLYVSEDGGNYTKLIHEYQKEKLRFLNVVQWSSVEQSTEVVVSDEAAINHCIMTNMMNNRYIVVVSYDVVLLFSTHHNNLKNFLRNDAVQQQFNRYGGFRILPVDVKKDLGDRATMLVKSRHVLSTAANHFIPLSGRPSFKIFDPLDIAAIPINKLGLTHVSYPLDSFLGIAAYKKLKTIGIDGVI